MAKKLSSQRRPVWVNTSPLLAKPQFALARRCAVAAFQGGTAASAEEISLATLPKVDAQAGHHAIVTEADYRSQAALMPVLRQDNRALFLTEEHVKDAAFRKRVLTAETLGLLTSRRVYVVDELDGSNSRERGHYEWSVSIGCVEKLVDVAGAIFVPCINGGELFVAQRGQGTYLMRRGQKERRLQVAVESDLKRCTVIFGPDGNLSKYPDIRGLKDEVADECRMIYCCGSAALAMSLAAAGRVHAVVQPLQAPWDWSAGQTIVKEAGGAVIFFEMPKEGDIYRLGKQVPQPQPEHFCPHERMLGFIAGAPAIVAQLWDRLCGGSSH